MQQPSPMIATARCGQIVEILSTGILRVLASRALQPASRVEEERASGRVRPTATPSRPMAVLAGR
ncbi:MAG: hypothetical protein RBU45_08350 [Myxococcota bacterium]|jgi:hypothetical protein|nr:hypothetical protein [Myxococcota bacterium]